MMQLSPELAKALSAKRSNDVYHRCLQWPKELVQYVKVYVRLSLSMHAISLFCQVCACKMCFNYSYFSVRSVQLQPQESFDFHLELALGCEHRSFTLALSMLFLLVFMGSRMGRFH